MSERLIIPLLSEFHKGRCVGYLEAGKSIRWTGLTLNVSRSTVERWWSHYRREGHVRRREGSGRPRLTSPAQDRKLVVNIKRNRFSPVSCLSREWACACSISISANGHKTCCDGWTSCASTCSADSYISCSQASSEAVVSEPSQLEFRMGSSSMDR